MSFSGMRHPWKLLVNARKLVRLVRTEQIDLIHGNAPQSNVPSGLAGRATGKPVVWQARVLLEPTMVDWERYLARLSSIIVCNSQAIRERFRSLRDYEDRTVAVLNGVDTKAFFPGSADGDSWRERAGISTSERVIGCFDRLDPIKNHETILHACKNVFEDLGAGTLVVVGVAFVESDQRMRELKALASRLGIAERVRFLGFVDDVRPAMAACDVIVHASLSEGCSRVLCEAQAMGRPVVASRVGGNPEVVRDGVSGYLYPASDAASLSLCVAALLGSEESRMEMGRRASKWAAQALSRERYCREIEQIYANLSS
jgi:glycosyltransferase involved in cell wall biosynthesis